MGGGSPGPQGWTLGHSVSFSPRSHGLPHPCQKLTGPFRVSLVVQMGKNLPATQEAQVQFLDPEDPLEKEMATHSSSLAWKIPWTEEPGAGYSPWGCRVGHD